MRSKWAGLALLGLLVAVFSLVAAGCGGDDGGGGDTVKIVSDLPLQGSDRVQTEQMVRGIEYVLEKAGNKAGDYTITFESFDDSTAAAGKWDEAKCSENARTYAQRRRRGGHRDVQPGCAGIEIPLLNEVPIAMVSPANTYAGLTHGAPAPSLDEPDKYYPGERNYARRRNGRQPGQDRRQFLKDDQGCTSVYILDDKELYGKGVADAFEPLPRTSGSRSRATRAGTSRRRTTRR